MLILERNKPGMCTLHIFENSFNDMQLVNWNIENSGDNTLLCSCLNCNLQRIYKEITTI